jgi:hypothetical protein
MDDAAYRIEHAKNHSKPAGNMIGQADHFSSDINRPVSSTVGLPKKKPPLESLAPWVRSSIGIETLVTLL